MHSIGYFEKHVEKTRYWLGCKMMSFAPEKSWGGAKLVSVTGCNQCAQKSQISPASMGESIEIKMHLLKKQLLVKSLYRHLVYFTRNNGGFAGFVDN